MDLSKLSQQVVDCLGQQRAKLVLAESCTSGLIAASLGCVPGVSQYLCGSAVVYRDQTKLDWLGVEASVIDEFTSVSEAATSAIARGVLEKSREATVSLGITGHLGPGSPEALDGKVFVACYRRTKELTITELELKQFQLETDSRSERQVEAAAIALNQLKQSLSDWR